MTLPPEPSRTVAPACEAEGSVRSNEHRIRTLPCWAGGVSIEPLHGGISNESYLVTDSAGRHVVRFGKDFSFHHVSREREIMTARAAHTAGFAPEVQYAEPGIMVTAFIGAKTYCAEDVRANRERIALLLRRFHTEMPRHVSGAGSATTPVRWMSAAAAWRQSFPAIWRSPRNWSRRRRRCR
jgi:thiamine kinase-like enzyme